MKPMDDFAIDRDFRGQVHHCGGLIAKKIGPIHLTPTAPRHDTYLM